jgi:hypothetical protein
LTADWVVEELRKIAGANMLDYMKSTPEDLSVVDFSGLTRDQTAALSQVTSGLTRDQTAALSQVTVEDVAGGKRVQFKLHDKRAAARKGPNQAGRALRIDRTSPAASASNSNSTTSAPPRRPV